MKRRRRISQAELHDRLEQVGWWRPFADLHRGARFKHFDEDEEFAEVDEAEELEEQEDNRLGHSVIRNLMADPNYRRRYLTIGITRDCNPRTREQSFIEGRIAFWRALKKSANPYQKNSLDWELWNEGWEFSKHVNQRYPKSAAKQKKLYARNLMKRK